MKSKASIEHFDVLIIGAGISALTAGYYLKKADRNLNILIVEAKNRVGGRTETCELKCSKSGEMSSWDLGAQWISNLQPTICQLIDELKIEKYEQISDEIQVELNGKVHELVDFELKINAFGALELSRILNQLNYDTNQCSALDPFLENPEYAEYLDGKTLDDLYVTNCYNETARSYMACLLKYLYSIECNQVNALNALFGVKGCVDFTTMICDGKDSASEYKIKGGTQQISQRLLDSILDCGGSSRIILDAPVIEVNQQDLSIVLVKVWNKQTDCVEVYSANKVISSIPLNLYEKVNFEPPLPEIKRHVFDFCRMGNYVKIVITYEKRFWKINVINDGSTYKPSTNDANLPKVGPFFLLLDTTNDCDKPALVAFSGADVFIAWSEVGPDVRERETISYIAQFHGPEAFEYVDYTEKIWMKEPYTGGCPATNVTSSGVMKYFVQAAREPFLNVHLCGTETACNWQGYMEGAAESGIRVANEVAYCLSKDQMYAEMKYDYTKTYYHQKSEIERLRKEVKKRKSYSKVIKYSIVAAISAILLFKLNKSFKK